MEILKELFLIMTSVSNFLHVANAYGKMRRSSYIHMDQPRFTVSGMPDKVPFKHPKDYNATELSAITANKDAIKFHGKLILYSS